ncbi:response regulator transcription factor [Enterococcus sp. 669A]|uniref:Response regulator transcription factor n=2 Tax=Candidatus Enterococcus moelleringii TaxID=2815325 RepID=A0ABS3LG55_9ENTE|nr:response regulator transcription factor [Enterococcus sp. 669A]
MKIMIIEDEPKIREELAALLRNALYQVALVTEFVEVTQQVQQAKPDLILLDIHLPGIDGHQLCGEIRRTMGVPIIFLTSDNSVMTETNSILMGGDDFIAKPYHPSVLLARITAVLKRSGGGGKEETVLEHKGVTLDVRSYKIAANGFDTELSKNECKLLHYLFLHKGEVVPRLDLIEYLWDNEVFIDDNALSVTMTRIRARLADIEVTNFVETKRGAGYKI